MINILAFFLIFYPDPAIQARQTRVQKQKTTYFGPR